MIRLDSISNLNKWRLECNPKLTLGLVPTMGALHEGHLSLVDVMKTRADKVIATIFVNPTQFAPGEDLDAYPRTLDSDLQKFENAGVDAVFIPTAQMMYPAGFATTVSVGDVANGLETDHRPHFFDGVATVVTKLFCLVRPDIAIFGEKDYQQLAVIRRFTADLNLPIDVIGGPTIREADGLAKSSRNIYLSEQERQIAPQIYQTLKSVAAEIREDGDISTCVEKGKIRLSESGFVVDYLEARHCDNLSELKGKVSPYKIRLLVAATLGKTRLIDNISALEA